MTCGNRSRRRQLAAAGIAALGYLMLLPVAYGDDVAAQARQVVDKYKNVVVSVRMVVETNMSMFGSEAQRQEQKTDVTGTVIDPSGLTVVSLFETDPAEMFRRFMPEQMPEGMKMDMESKVTGLKLRFGDGKEVAAKVVLRDKDLDLAFVRPEQKLPAPVAAADLTQSVRPQLMDQVVTLSRMGQVADWAIGVGLDRISVVLQKPRMMYGTGTSAFSGLGAPAFTLDGKVIGVLVMRSSPGAAIGGMPTGINDLGMLPVILPAADVLDAAKQAAE